jgi:hypothetical protein
MSMETTTANPRPAPSLKRAAVGLFEALPAILLAAALLAPAFAALADDTPRPHDESLGLIIADQGNRALLAIRADARALREAAHPALPAAPTTVAQADVETRS